MFWLGTCSPYKERHQLVTASYLRSLPSYKSWTRRKKKKQSVIEKLRRRPKEWSSCSPLSNLPWMSLFTSLWTNSGYFRRSGSSSVSLQWNLMTFFVKAPPKKKKKSLHRFIVKPALSVKCVLVYTRCCHSRFWYFNWKNRQVLVNYGNGWISCIFFSLGTAMCWMDTLFIDGVFGKPG